MTAVLSPGASILQRPGRSLPPAWPGLGPTYFLLITVVWVCPLFLLLVYLMQIHA